MDARIGDEQRYEADRQRMPGLWPVHEGIEVRDGLLRPVHEHVIEKVYPPAAAAAAVRDLRAVVPGSESHALAFAKRWGLLGYGPRRLGWPTADPLAWFWAHANGVRLVFDLEQAIRRGDEAKIAESLKPHLHEDGDADLIHGISRRLDSGQHAEAAELASRVFGKRVSGGYPGVVYGNVQRPSFVLFPTGDWMEIAKRAIERILNSNLSAGVHRQVSYREDHPEIYFRSPNLLGYLYHHIADILSGPLLECRYCETPFRVTHGRQRFCPPEPWVKKRNPKGESSCALKYRARKSASRQTREGK